MGKLSIKNLSFKYNNIFIFKDLSIEIKTGDFVTICGKGKTTLAKILMNKLNYNGNIKVDDRKLNDSIQNMFVIIEDIKSVFLDGTVRENICYYLKKRKLNNSNIEMISFLGIEYLLDYNVKYLSEGEKALVALCISFMLNPKILILDETLSMLDGTKKEKIFKYLKKINKDNGVTIINLTNDLEECLYSKRVILLDKQVVLNETLKKAFLDAKIYETLDLELPFMVTLSNKLRYYDLIDEIFLNMDKMVDKLWK